MNTRVEPVLVIALLLVLVPRRFAETGESGSTEQRAETLQFNTDAAKPSALELAAAQLQ